MREIWMMQPRFERRQANTAFSMIEGARFRAGFDFLRLRADVGEAPVELAEWWEDFSLGSDEEREALLVAVREALRGSARKAPAARAGHGAAGRPAEHDGAAAAGSAAEPAGAPVTEGGPDIAGDDADGDSPGGSAPARKRRRRRRKPSGGAGGGDAGGDSGGDSTGEGAPAAG
jgi:poly(A) polymerase